MSARRYFGLGNVERPLLVTRDASALAAGDASGLVPAVFAGRVFPYAIRICIVLISILNHLNAETSQYPH